MSGGAGLVFKGSGFYITDYGKDGKGPAKDPSKEPSKKEGGEKPEAKPEPAGDTKSVKAEKPVAKDGTAKDGSAKGEGKDKK
jgi:hypothetical protein